MLLVCGNTFIVEECYWCCGNAFRVREGYWCVGMLLVCKCSWCVGMLLECPYIFSDLMIENEHSNTFTISACLIIQLVREAYLNMKLRHLA